MRICEIFRSLQGEGINIGLPTVFVRTQGCNLRCTWCDTSYAWELDGEDIGIDVVIRRLERYSTRRICVTGGEPLLQDDIYDLLNSLKGYSVSVETNGSLDISRLTEMDVMLSMDYKTPSSGMEEQMLDDNVGILHPSDQLKFVIFDENDHEFAVDVLLKYEPKAVVVFQPAWRTDIRSVVNRVLEDDLDVRVLPQLHKFIWGEKRGV